jgi:hypothetical protein
MLLADIVFSKPLSWPVPPKVQPHVLLKMVCVSTMLKSFTLALLFVPLVAASLSGNFSVLTYNVAGLPGEVSPLCYQYRQAHGLIGSNEQSSCPPALL